MTELDLKNYKVIETLVENHFSLDQKSLTTFKKRLYEPDLDDVYKEIFSNTESLRMRFKIGEEFLENFDKGWAHFIKLFPRFMRNVNVNYTAFRENKVFFNGKILKLKKALLDYYINNPDMCIREFGWRENFNPKNEAHLQELEAHVIQNLDIVGRYKLPSKGMELVLSANFADWFLCASGEKWHSCVSLESNFAGAFWTGIPGIIIDKNRTMMYLTDGSTKSVCGISTESLISRSWILLDESNKLNSVRFFPSQMLGLKVIKGVTGLNFSEEENRKFTTKHPIDFLYFMNNKSCFVYVDFGRFIKKPEGIFIEYAERGRFAYHDKIKDKIIEGSHIYVYTHGLQYLIDKNISLNDLIIKTCLSCGSLFDQEDLVNLEGQTFCKLCYAKNVCFCEECHIAIPKRSENRYKYVGRTIYCKECFDKNFTICHICEKAKKKNEVIFIRERETNYCKDCLKEEELTYVSCDTCHEGLIEPLEDSFEYLYDETKICKICLRKEMDKKQLFLEFPPPENQPVFEHEQINFNFMNFLNEPIATIQNPVRFDWGEIRVADATTRNQMREIDEFIVPPPIPPMPEFSPHGDHDEEDFAIGPEYDPENDFEEENPDEDHNGN